MEQVGIVAADARQRAVWEAFAAEGYETRWLTKDDAFPPIVVLPMPVSTDGVHLYGGSDRLEDWWVRLRGRTVFGGRCTPEILAQAAQYDVRLLDHFDREEEVVLNVIPTVEGALQLAMEQTPFTIHGSNALVCGFGRIGKLLAHRLSALGAKVCVSARKEKDFAWCNVWGYDSVDVSTLTNHIAGKHLLFNTVPHLLFDGEKLDQMRDDALLIDLASAPGGVDFAYAAAAGKRAVQALGLPGKVAPRTAGEIICKTIIGMYKEENTLGR